MEKKELEEKLRGLIIFTEGDGQGQATNTTLEEELGEYAMQKVLDLFSQELDRAREEGYQKGWEDGSKGKVFEKIEVETEVTFKDLRDVIEGKEDAWEFLSKLTTK